MKEEMPGMLDDGSPHEAAAHHPDVAAGASFRLRLLGPFQLSDRFDQQVNISSKKSRLLLAMLACAPGHSMSRETLAGLLWAEHGDEQARASLRQALASLRKDLGGQDASLLAATDTTIALLPAQVDIDTDAFLAHTRSPSSQSLAAAIGLWRGPFLADVRTGEATIEEWLHARRDEYGARYIAAMDQLVPLLAGHDRIELAKRLVQADSLREASHRQLMEAYLAAGERAPALQQFEALRKRLHQELGVEPSAELRALRDRIAASGTGPSPPSPPEPPADARGAGRTFRNLVALVLGSVVVAAAAVAAVWVFTRPPPPPAFPPTIAVLPFQSPSGDAADARLAQGLTIDTITDLSRYQDFRVIAKDTTDVYKGKTVDVRALGEDLKVSHVLRGTFDREKDHIRVTAQLIDAATGETLWSDRYDRLLGEFFAIQSDVASHIANSLGGRAGRIGESMLADARRKPPADLSIYETYLMAQERMYSDLSDESMKAAQGILDQVIARDPAFARAYVRYANAYAWRFTYEAGAADLMQQMLAYARKAVALDPMDADAHAALGYSLTLTGNAKQGEAHLNEALRLTPNSFDVLIFHACLSHAYGKPDKGAEAAERAVAINPAFPNWAVPCLRLGLVLVGRYDEVIRIQSRQPEAEWNTDGFVIMAGSLASLGKSDEAAAFVKRGLERFPGLLSIERFALNRGWPPEASKVMADLMRRAGFPACATSQDLADTPNPVRLTECKG